jgi:hypothetical protein
MMISSKLSEEIKSILKNEFNTLTDDLKVIQAKQNLLHEKVNDAIIIDRKIISKKLDIIDKSGRRRYILLYIWLSIVSMMGIAGLIHVFSIR